MTLTFAGILDHSAVLRSVGELLDLVSTSSVAAAWERESALSGMTVGGLARHLVSQPECTVEFLRAEPPANAEPVSLLDYYARVDWLDARTEDIENTSIRDHFNELAGEGPGTCVSVLERAYTELPDALAAAMPPARYRRSDRNRRSTTMTRNNAGRATVSWAWVLRASLSPEAATSVCTRRWGCIVCLVPGRPG